MGLSSVLNHIWQQELNPDQIRQLTLPAGAAVTATANAAGSTYGNWIDVALAATILQNTLIVGVIVSAPSAPDVFTVDIGSCLVGGVNYANAAAVVGGGAGVIAAAHRQEVRVESQGAGGGGAADIQITQGWLPLHTPIWIPTGVGIIARCYGITAAAVTIDVSVACKQGF